MDEQIPRPIDEHNMPSVKPLEESVNIKTTTAPVSTGGDRQHAIEALGVRISALESGAKQQAYISALNTVGIILVGIVVIKVSRELAVAP